MSPVIELFIFRIIHEIELFIMQKKCVSRKHNSNVSEMSRCVMMGSKFCYVKEKAFVKEGTCENIFQKSFVLHF